MTARFRVGLAGRVLRPARAALCAIPLLAMMLAGLVGAADAVDGPSRVAEQVIEQVNAARARHGLAALETDARLDAAARQFAQYMASTDHYGHEADGRPPAERAAAEGYEYCLVAENIAYVFNSGGYSAEALSAQLMSGWMQSPGHRRNILLEQATDFGFGVAQSSRSKRYYAVQLFGRPRSASTQFQVVNRAGAPTRYDIDGESFELPVRVTRTHTRCAESTVRFAGAHEAEVRSGVRARNGARYVVTRDESGRVSVQMN